MSGSNGGRLMGKGRLGGGSGSSGPSDGPGEKESTATWLADDLPVRCYAVPWSAKHHDFNTRVRLALASGKFVPLSHLGEDEMHIGYCDARDASVIDSAMIDYSPCAGRVLVGVRVETIKVSSGALKVEVIKQTEEWRLKNDNRRPANFAKKEIEEVAKRELRKKTPPQMKVVPIMWSVNDGLVRIFCSSASLIDDIVALFNNTFGAMFVGHTKGAGSIVPITSATMGLIGGLFEPNSSVLEIFDSGISPTVFTTTSNIVGCSLRSTPKQEVLL